MIEVEGLGDLETLFEGEKVALSDGLGGMMSDLEGVLEPERVLEVVGEFVDVFEIVGDGVIDAVDENDGLTVAVKLKVEEGVLD